MTAPAAESLLSRDEMDALLEELATARREDAERRQRLGVGPSGDPHAALRRGLEEFAASYGRHLSTAYQRRIDWLLRDTAVVDPRDIAETAPPGELFWVFGPEASVPAWMSWSRSLVFAWLQVAFGAPEPRGLAPERPYTAIERSFLVQIAQESVAALAEPLRAFGFESGEGGHLVKSSELLSLTGTSFVQAQFEVRGFGDNGQVRVGLPESGAALRPGPAARGPRARAHAHHPAVLEAPVSIHAEVGSAEISVESLASLRTGDVLRVRVPSDGSLLLRVGDTPKFRAIRGSIGERLAVQVTERIKESR